MARHGLKDCDGGPEALPPLGLDEWQRDAKK